MHILIRNGAKDAWSQGGSSGSIRNFYANEIQEGSIQVDTTKLTLTVTYESSELLTALNLYLLRWSTCGFEPWSM